MPGTPVGSSPVYVPSRTAASCFCADNGTEINKPSGDLKAYIAHRTIDNRVNLPTRPLFAAWPCKFIRKLVKVKHVHRTAGQ